MTTPQVTLPREVVEKALAALEEIKLRNRFNSVAVPASEIHALAFDAAEAITAAIKQADNSFNTWICPRCKIDRLKEPCPSPSIDCPMKGEAQ